MSNKNVIIGKEKISLTVSTAAILSEFDCVNDDWYGLTTLYVEPNGNVGVYMADEDDEDDMVNPCYFNIAETDDPKDCWYFEKEGREDGEILTEVLGLTSNDENPEFLEFTFEVEYRIYSSIEEVKEIFGEDFDEKKLALKVLENGQVAIPTCYAK